MWQINGSGIELWFSLLCLWLPLVEDILLSRSCYPLRQTWVKFNLRKKFQTICNNNWMSSRSKQFNSLNHWTEEKLTMCYTGTLCFIVVSYISNLYIALKIIQVSLTDECPKLAFWAFICTDNILCCYFTFTPLFYDILVPNNVKLESAAMLAALWRCTQTPQCFVQNANTCTVKMLTQYVFGIL